MEFTQEDHQRVSGIFRAIALECMARSKIRELASKIREAKHAETKRYLMKEMGEQRELLHAYTRSEAEQRLARNCFRVAQYGFKRFE
jgi:hypothetical protein